MIYEWGSRTFSVDPQTVGETVERLSKQHGGACPPAAVVDEARPDDSPLHPAFEWDDARAAEAHRRQQARKLVNSLVVVTEDTRVRPAAFVHVKVVNNGDQGEGYAPFYEVVSDEGKRQQAMDEALRYLNGFRRRWRHLSELGPVFDAIDEVEGRT